MLELSSTIARALLPLAILFSKFTFAFDSLWQPIQNGELVGYSRVIQLQHAGGDNGKLLATFEHWHNDTTVPSYYIIRESTDNGTTWDTLTNVTAPDVPTSTQYFQPFFFEFPQQLGTYPEGTILLVGNMVYKNTTDFHSWRSSDHGKSWDHIKMWQHGWSPGDARNNASHGIWEPFLYLDNQNHIVALFSDERFVDTHSQKLVEVVSTDGGDNWSEPTDIVLGSRQSSRPGMATVAKMDNGEYFMSYEWCDTWMYPRPCAARGKMSKDGWTWDAAFEGVDITSPDGVQGIGSPYSLWDPVGKQLIVSSHSKRQYSKTPFWDDPEPPQLPEDRHAVHINRNYGSSGDWHWASAPWYMELGDAHRCNVNYSPNLLALPNGTILYSAKTQAVLPDGTCEQSTGAGPIAALPYSSDFADTGSASWIDFDQIWTVSDGRYNFPPVTSPATIVLTGSSGWTDYEISADANVTSSPGVVGLLARAFRLEGASNGITRYTAAIDTSRGDFTVYRVGNGTSTALTSKPVSGGLKTNQIYHLSLSVKAATIVATVTGNGVNVSVSVTDDLLGRGMAGLFGSYGSGGFSNVQIKALT